MTQEELARSVIERLLDHLDAEYTPERMIDREGNESATRDWLAFRCFSTDHDLYDDVLTVVGAHRVFQREVKAR